LVILDLIMPVMDGNRCLEEILKVDAAATVLIAGGHYFDGATRAAVEGGAKGFIRMQYNLKELLKIVRDVLAPESETSDGTV
jgi:two-component system, cell cycle sensor histidine kinase and response regulator CckA